jgi:hypothetical protein
MLKSHKLVNNKPKHKPQFFPNYSVKLKIVWWNHGKDVQNPTNLVDDSIHHFNLVLVT